MKKIFVLLFGLLAAGQVFAQAAGNTCTAAATSADGAIITVIGVGTPSFVVVPFTPKCSANTFVSFEQNAVAFVVGSASSKGKNAFLGSSGGGGVSGQKCAGVTCIQTDATSRLAAALALAT